MILQSFVPPIADVMHAWRRQIGHRRAVAADRGPRPFAVVGYRIRGPFADDHYVRLRHFTMTALFDERLVGGELLTRFVGVGGMVGADGLRFGGPDLSRFDKNLRLPPWARGRGSRLDAADGEFCESALALERHLERCARHPYMPRSSVPRLPVLDAGILTESDCVIDVSTLPKRQVIPLTAPEDDLVGRAGSTSFDFYHTRFRVAP